MRISKKDLCINLSIRLPFFNVRPEDIRMLLASGEVLERIATGLCIPYLEKREEYRAHIPRCETCRPIYEQFLKLISQKSGIPVHEADRDYLGVFERL